MNHLLRSLAPISDSGWKLLDEEARERLDPALAARRLVDFSGPHGWEYSATNLGRTDAARLRPVRRRDRRSSGGCCPWSRCGPTSSSRRRSCATPTGAPRTPTSSRSTRPRTRSPWPRTRRCSTAGTVRSTGIEEATPHAPIALGETPDDYPRPVAGAVERLLHNGVSGPYGLALGGEQYQRVTESAEHGGYPLLEHLRKILEGPIVWAPGVGGALVLSLRGGDFLFESGQDLSIGYDGHDGDVVRLVSGGELQLPRRHPGGGRDAQRRDHRAETSALTRSATVSIRSRPTSPGVASTGAAEDKGSLR